MNSYKKGNVIFHEGDICQQVGQLISGQLLIRSYLVDGQEIIYLRLMPGDFFGHNLIFSNDKHYRGDIVAATDAEVLFFDKTVFIKKIQTDEHFLNIYLEKQVNELKELHHKHRLLTISKLKERFLYLLAYQGGELESDSVGTLAKELAVSRESLSRLLSKLDKDGLINIQKDYRYIKIKKKG